MGVMVQDFCFKGENYITKKVSLVGTSLLVLLFIPTKYYQNLSKGNNDTSRDGWMDAILITISPEPSSQGIKMAICRKERKK